MVFNADEIDRYPFLDACLKDDLDINFGLPDVRLDRTS